MVSLQQLTATDQPELEQVRQFFRNYAASIGVDLSFQNFAEEMANLPGGYAEPHGRLYLATLDGKPVGCVGVRQFSDGVAELKRLYVTPDARRMGTGRLLALAAIQAAQELGYQRLVLDTLPSMRMALKLYRQLGFQEIPAYYPSPVEGMVFLALDLNQTVKTATDSSGPGGPGGPDEQLQYLFDYNRAWARQMTELDPDFFTRLSEQQNPQYLWIGCSDSRVPANQIIGLLPGEVFVHRNVANVVVHTDLNCLSVLQFAVDVLKVRHIMVVGHYGCSGVRAALAKQRIGLADLWLHHVQAVHQRHRALIDSLPPAAQHDRLCELNVLEQVANICQTNIVQDAWARSQPVSVHGWLYALNDGLLRDLGLTVSQPEQLEQHYETVLARLASRSPNQPLDPAGAQLTQEIKS
ncbi:MAG: carbonate dehydratase [Gammaproteobacteria bacterium]